MLESDLLIYSDNKIHTRTQFWYIIKISRKLQGMYKVGFSILKRETKIQSTLKFKKTWNEFSHHLFQLRVRQNFQKIFQSSSFSVNLGFGLSQNHFVYVIKI